MNLNDSSLQRHKNVRRESWSPHVLPRRAFEESEILERVNRTFSLAIAYFECMPWPLQSPVSFSKNNVL